MKFANCLAAVLLACASLAGCSMCQAPFDCCGPVVRGCGLLNCDWGARRGSAVHPMDDDPEWVTAQPASAVGPASVREADEPVPESLPEYQ